MAKVGEFGSVSLNIVLAVLLALVACEGDEEPSSKRLIPESKLRELVLQPRDLPNEFTVFDEGELARADMPPGPRGDPNRFGRRGGWKGRYRRAGTRTTEGPLVVESRADLFTTEQGAKRDLGAYEAQFERDARDAAGPAEFLPPPDVGDEAVAMTLRQGSGDTAVRFYFVAWRQLNATASVVVTGFEGRIRLGEALELANKQARRIAQSA